LGKPKRWAKSEGRSEADAVKKRWIEVAVTIPSWWIDVLSHHLERLGFSSLWIDEETGGDEFVVVRCYRLEAKWRPHLIAELEACLKELGRFFPGGVKSGRVKVRTLPEEDWASKWLRFFVPFKIGNVWIRCSRKSVVLRDGERELVLDPGQAFGTGHHETTRLCMERIRYLRAEMEDHAVILDLGTGTGILAMFAQALGFKHVTATDIDVAAVETARKNLVKNRIASSVQLVAGSEDCLKGPFDLIVANLSFPVLRELPAKLSNRLKRSGWLVMSGFLKDDVRTLDRRFSAQGFHQVDISVQNEWACTVYRNGMRPLPEP
jgi:ribosomal protein L11 methyltransferase